MSSLHGRRDISLISTHDMTLGHGTAPALQGGNFPIDTGEIVTVVGPNGSGKPTLVRALIGLTPIAKRRISRKPGLRIGYVPQRLHIKAGHPRGWRSVRGSLQL